MTTRLYTSQDYATVARWFEEHGGKPVPASILPKCGVVTEESGELLAAVWLYQDNSVGVAWMAWLVSNPTLTPQKAAKALETAVEAIQEVARALNYGVLFTMTEKSGLGRWLRCLGFVPNHSGMTQFWKPLHHGT